MAFTFDPIFATDPNNPANVAANAAITIFDPNDAGKAPITITDPTGSPIPNPVTVNKNGFGTAFQHATLDRVGWSGGGFEGYFTSYEGMKNEAVAAREAANTAAANAAAEVSTALSGAVSDAEAAAAAAADAAALVDAPADEAIATAISGTGTQTQAALDAVYATRSSVESQVPPLVIDALAADPTPANAAAAAVDTALEDANVVTTAEVPMRKVGFGWSTLDGREVFWMNEDASFSDYTGRKIRNSLLFPKEFIVGFNDSFGSGVYVTVAARTGLPVREYTEGGQTSQRIAARQGGVRALFSVTGNTVPASGAVTIASWSANPIMGATNTPRMGTIGGVKGTLTYAADAGQPTNEYAGTMTFTRIGTGTAVSVANPVEFICAEEASADGYGVLMAFTNDRLGVPINNTVSNIVAMVDRFESKVKRVLVMGSFPAADMTLGTALRTDFDARRNAVKDAVRGQWFDPFTDYFMTDQVFTDMGLTMTANDIADRNNGLVPRQLRGDSIHLTQAAKDKLALYIANEFKNRGWIKTVL